MPIDDGNSPIRLVLPGHVAVQQIRGSAKRTTETWRRVVWVSVGLLVTAGALAYSLARVDIGELTTRIARADYTMVAPVLFLLFLHFSLKAKRWAMLLAPLGSFRAAEVAPPLMIGAAGNNLLPVHLGDVLRAAILCRRYQKPFAAVFVSQIVERILDVSAVLGIYFIGVFSLPRVPESLRASGWGALMATMVAVAGAALLLKKGATVLSIWDRLTRRMGHGLRSRGRAILADAILGLSSVRNLRRLLLLFGNSLLQWLCMTGVIWSSLFAFGESTPFGVSMIVLAAVILAVTVPAAPGYVGSIQAAFLLALSPFGADPNLAFGASVFFLAVPWIAVTSVGAGCFIIWHLRLAEVRADVAQVEEDRS